MAPHGTDDHDENQVPPPEPPPAAEVSRRAFLQTVGAAGAAGAAGTAGGVVAQGVAVSAQARPAQAPPAQGANTPPVERPYMRIRQEVAENLVKRGIVGYADRLRVQPGETIRFMVSSEVPRYRADIVRLIHGDANPSGPGIKETVVDTPANGEYAGRRQELPLGSYAFVPDHPSLRLTGSFSFTAWIAPTSQRGATPDSFVGIEGVLTKWAGARGGYGIFIDEEGRLALWIRRRLGQDREARRPPAAPAVGAGDSGHERPAAGGDHGLVLRRRHLRCRLRQGRDPPGPAEHLHLRSDPRGHRAVGDNPDAGDQRLAAAHRRLPGSVRTGSTRTSTARSTTRGSTARCSAGRPSRTSEQGLPGPPPLAAWDFAADIESERITDAGPVRLHGRTVNLPMRAVTGHNWDSFEMDYKQARPQYGAIYFHDDDIDDAGWDVGFEFRVPDALKSGMYAARLRGGSFEDYIPFTVRPRKGQPTSARIALLIPTFSYLAYAGTGTSAFRPLSLYSRHSDGSGVCYSSRLRPITNMRPKIADEQPLAVHGRHAPHRLARGEGSSRSTSSPTRTCTSRAPRRSRPTRSC